MSKIEKSGSVLRRDRKPGELLTRAAAIRSECLRCCGGNFAEVEKCQTPGCHFYPYRYGKSRLDPEIHKEKERYGEEFPDKIDYEGKDIPESLENDSGG